MKRTHFLALAALLLASSAPGVNTWPCNSYPTRKNPYTLGQIISVDVGSNPQNPAGGYIDNDPGGGNSTTVPVNPSCGVYHADLTTGLYNPTYISGNRGYVGNGATCPAQTLTFVWNGQYADDAYGTADSNDSTRQPPAGTGYSAAAQETCDVIAQVWASCDYTGSDCPANQIGKGYCEIRAISAQQQAWALMGGSYPWAWDTSPSPMDECLYNPVCTITLQVNAPNSKVTADLICHDGLAPWNYNGQYSGSGNELYEAHMWMQADAQGQISFWHDAYLPAYGPTIGYPNDPNNTYRYDVGWFFTRNPDGTHAPAAEGCGGGSGP